MRLADRGWVRLMGRVFEQRSRYRRRHGRRMGRFRHPWAGKGIRDLQVRFVIASGFEESKTK